MGALKIKPRTKLNRIRRKAFKMWRSTVKSEAHLEQILSAEPNHFVRARMRKEIAPALSFRLSKARVDGSEG